MLNLAEKPAECETGSTFLPSVSAEHRRAETWLDVRIREGMRGIYTIQVELTPTMAKLLLLQNPNNRTIKSGIVDKYAIDIAERAWQENGESVKISTDGYLNDGQHRCQAVIQADRSIMTSMTFGCERESRLTLDQGGIRSPGDYLGMSGVENANQAAAVVSLLWQHEKSGRVSNQTTSRPTKSQIVDNYGRYPDIQDSLRTAHRKGATLIGGGSVLAFCHYLFARKDKEAADRFIARLIVGDNLMARDPIFLCRDRLLNNKRMKVEEKVELIVRAWNAHRLNKKQSKLQIEGGNVPKIEA